MGQPLYDAPARSIRQRDATRDASHADQGYERASGLCCSGLALVPQLGVKCRQQSKRPRLSAGPFGACSVSNLLGRRLRRRGRRWSRGTHRRRARVYLRGLLITGRRKSEQRANDQNDREQCDRETPTGAFTHRSTAIAVRVVKIAIDIAGIVQHLDLLGLISYLTQ